MADFRLARLYQYEGDIFDSDAAKSESKNGAWILGNLIIILSNYRAPSITLVRNELKRLLQNAGENERAKIPLVLCAPPRWVKKLLDEGLGEETPLWISPSRLDERESEEIAQFTIEKTLDGQAYDLWSNKQEFEMSFQKDCEDKVRRVFDKIKNTPNNNINNKILIPRDAMLYSWILQRLGGEVKVDELIHLVGTALDREVIFYIETELLAGNYLEQLGDDSFIIKKEMMAAIETVFGETAHYSITTPVPFFPNQIKGFELVMHFVNMTEIGQFPPVAEMVRTAFLTALNTIEIKPLDKAIYLVSKAGLWDFILCAVSNNGAISGDYFRSLAWNLVRKRGRNMEQQILLFAPNSEDITVYKEVMDFPGFNHVWSISTVRLFNGLQKVIADYGSQSVAEKFPAIFPPDGESFGTSQALNNLRAALEPQH